MKFKKLGNLLKEARERSGLTQAQVGKLFKMHPMSICDWERGKVDIPFSKIVMISAIYDLNINEMTQCIMDYQVRDFIKQTFKP